MTAATMIGSGPTRSATSRLPEPVARKNPQITTAMASHIQPGPPPWTPVASRLPQLSWYHGVPLRPALQRAAGRKESAINAPVGYTTVAPWIVTDDTPALLEFIGRAFDGVESAMVPLEDGSIGHAEIRVGDTVLLAFDRRQDWPRTPSLLRVFVADADAATDAAVAAGASIVTPLLTQAFGQRGSRVRDPFGNIWWITAVVEDVPPDEVFRRLSEPRFADAMHQAQESLDRELSRREQGEASPPVPN